MTNKTGVPVGVIGLAGCFTASVAGALEVASGSDLVDFFIVLQVEILSEYLVAAKRLTVHIAFVFAALGG